MTSLPRWEHNPPPHTFITSITITFPDGHATKFKIAAHECLARIQDPRVGPPYYGDQRDNTLADGRVSRPRSLAEMARTDANSGFTGPMAGQSISSESIRNIILDTPVALSSHGGLRSHGFRTELILRLMRVGRCLRRWSRKAAAR